VWTIDLRGHGTSGGRCTLGDAEALDVAAATLIRTWLVKKQNAMLVDFLNALGIENKEGVIENLPKAMDDAKLKSAVDVLLAKYPHERIAVYLNAFNDMNETN